MFFSLMHKKVLARKILTNTKSCRTNFFHYLSLLYMFAYKKIPVPLSTKCVVNKGTSIVRGTTLIRLSLSTQRLISTYFLAEI